ncbi:hypothetical protein HS088_TW09G01319 [Tripterygium wilfordii]|uniref:Uncharacterized protein n=1 Tax=Tripterygium wilfordii TaxID=458696 RepID=A0A7J7DA88_TRIWF|nr:hypothetical protein HS088_TW09G01319 [Tripterygium wilfordii]
MGMIKNWRSRSVRETIQLGKNHNQSSNKELDPKQRWIMFWRKISIKKKKISNDNMPVTLQAASYDPDAYLQNFDHGTGWAEPDNLSRSFSSRFADPSRF